MHFLPRACWGLGVAALPNSPALAQATLPAVPLVCQELAPDAIRPSRWLGRTGDGWQETSCGLNGAVPPAASACYWNAANAPTELTVTNGHRPSSHLAAGVAPQPVTPRDGIYKCPIADATEILIFIPHSCNKLCVVA